MFDDAKLVVFCDGDFWHGKGLRQRLERLASGHNAAYWSAKIQANVRRDRRNNRALRQIGWRVFRFWESEIVKRADQLAAQTEVELLGDN